MTDAPEPAEEPVSRIELAPSYFAFRIGGIQLLCPAQRVEAVTTFDTPTALPRVPDHILGLVNHDHRALVVLDLHRFLRLPDETPPHYTRTLVLEGDAFRVGVPVDAALGLQTVTPEDLNVGTSLHGGRLPEFLECECETDAGVAGILDVARILEAARV